MTGKLCNIQHLVVLLMPHSSTKKLVTRLNVLGAQFIGVCEYIQDIYYTLYGNSAYLDRSSHIILQNPG